MEKSKISVDFDLNANGKFFGYARIPHSVTRSAYGWLPIPMVSIRNGPGKTILLMAGTHGDEYEGQIALSRLAQQITPDQIEGRLIILPMTNYPAAKAGLRVSPIDDVNLARIFPGDPSGTITQMIAHFIDTELMSQSDLIIDLHSGGASLNYLPSVTAVTEDGAELTPEHRRYLELFGCPYALQFSGRKGNGSASDAASRHNILRIGSEMGGNAQVNRVYREICENGTKRILHHLGVLKDVDIPPPPDVKFLKVTQDCFVYAHHDGIFEPAASLGDHVVAGQLAGYLYFPNRPLTAPEPVYFDRAGLVVCERPNAMCEVGDCLFHLAV